MVSEAHDRESDSSPDQDRDPDQELDRDPERVRREIRRRGRDIERRERERALARLEATGGLTDAQREIVAELAATIVDELLAVPDETLRRASERDSQTVDTALELFERD